MRKTKLLLLLLVPLLSVILGGAALVKLHENYERRVQAGRAQEVAQYEMRRLTASLNYRLNEIREELLHLYGEQLNLARALSEAERERFVFYRRDYLAGFAVLVRGGQPNSWEVQKYYSRATNSKPVLDIFRAAPSSVRERGFGIKKVQAALFNPPWPTSGSQADAYAVAFNQTDEAGRPFTLVGVFRPSYVFPFCKFFSDSLGEMPTNVFVLDDVGRVICHSQPKYDGVDFKQYGLYEQVSRQGEPNGLVRYTNVSGSNVVATAKRVQSGGLTLVAEAAEVSPWELPIPLNDLAVVAGAVTLITLVSALFAVRLATKGFVAAGAAANADKEVPPPATDSLGVELSEFSKLRRELKELEATLLDLQAMHAFLAGFQKTAVELAPNEDLGRMVVDYLGVWKVPLAWCPAAGDGLTVSCGPFANWEKAPEPFQIELGSYKHPADLGHDPDVFMKLSMHFSRDDLAVQPVYYQEQLLGLLVVAGAGERAEALPQLSQVMAFVERARARGANA